LALEQILCEAKSKGKTNPGASHANHWNGCYLGYPLKATLQEDKFGTTLALQKGEHTKVVIWRYENEKSFFDANNPVGDSLYFCWV